MSFTPDVSSTSEALGVLSNRSNDEVTLRIDVSDYALEDVSVIPIDLDNLNQAKSEVLNLVNTDFVSEIMLQFISDNNFKYNVSNFIIQCLDLCSVSINNSNHTNIQITELFLVNAVLKAKPINIEVEYFSLIAHEEIKTALPTVKRNAEITTLPFEDQLVVKICCKELMLFQDQVNLCMIQKLNLTYIKKNILI